MHLDELLLLIVTESEYARIEEVERQRTMQEPSSFTFTPLTLRVENETYDIANETVLHPKGERKVANVIKVPPSALRRTQSQEGSLDALATIWEAPKMVKSRSADYELCQIYDTVRPLTKVRDDKSSGFNKTSHPGYPMKGLSSLSCNDTQASSDVLYTSLYIQSELDCGSVYDVPKKAALGYSVPDVKRRKENLEYKGRSDEVLTHPEEAQTLSELDCGSAYDVPKKAALGYSVPDVKRRKENLEYKGRSDEVLTHSEEAQILTDFSEHYDTPKCRNTSKTSSLLYNQPSIQIHHGEV